MKNVSITPLGDCAVVIDLGDKVDLEKNQRLLAMKEIIETKPFPGFVETVPAYTTLTIFYDPVYSSYETVKIELLHILQQPQSVTRTAGKIIEIAVCYEEPFALDLDFVAEHNGLTVEEVVDLHTSPLYNVYFLGFAPGFPFLGGMNKSIAAPRKTSPRLKIPRGSVGIAGSQTGIYPLDSPGGWQIIGRTPLPLFKADAAQPTFILPGDQIRFVPISKEEFIERDDVPWPSRS